MAGVRRPEERRRRVATATTRSPATPTRAQKQITFKWKKPYAAWQDIFGVIYPSQALAGLDFNKIWTNCICGNDGKPISDGPFILTNYTNGQGSTFKVNPFWYGKKPKLKEVDFKIITDTNTEVQAMRGGEVDAINPTFGINLLPLKSTPGVTFNQVPGLYQEHIDIQFGPKGQPLLRSPWMRQALMMGIDRASIIKTVYSELAGNTKPLDSLVYYPADASYKTDFAKWNYNPTKALALLKKHCTGGPSSPSAGNSSMFTCAGLPAKFRFTWTASNATRTTQEAIIKAQLKSIGIEIVDASLPANVVFGPTGIPGVELRPRRLRLGDGCRPGRLRADLGLRWRGELPQLLQPQGDAAAGGIEQRARPGEAGEALPAGGRDDGERRPVDPAVRTPEPARLEVGGDGDEEQPVERRLLVEHGGVGLEVALLDLTHRDGPASRGPVALSGAEAQQLAQGRRRRTRLAADDARQVRVIGEAEVGGHACERALAFADALERGARAKAVAVVRDRLARLRGEDAAQVVRRQRDVAREREQAQPRVGGQELAHGVDGSPPRAVGRASRGDGLRDDARDEAS